MKKFVFLFSVIVFTIVASAQLPQINLVQLATAYASPVDIKTCGDQRLFIVEQKGIIRILYKDGTKQTTPFLDIDARVNSASDEQGLLGLAFSPNYKQDGYFYVNYINGSGFGSTRISRFSVMPTDSTQADPNSEVVLLTFAQPNYNHNGGNMMFGPDGYLYVSVGDGGGRDDVNGNGQNKNTFLGKILRIDVTGQTTYVVPSSNPFVGVPSTKPEIWAYGLRNPWRCSFDKLTDDMWIGDVGQDYYEEIDFQYPGIAGGQNYGWRCREGFHACPTCNTSGCPSTGFVDPIAEISHGGGSCSTTGGYVYRGTQYRKLFGLYLFSDYCDGSFWTIKKTGSNTFDVDTLQNFANYQYTSFGQDDLGELYVAYRGSPTGSTGRIYRIGETTDCNPVAFISFKDSIEGCSPVTISALKGDTLSYQWYNSSGIISGAGSYQYAAQQSGWYKVKVAKQQVGCEAMSDSIYVKVLDTTALIITNPTIVTCVNSSNVGLAANASPTGGVFSGSGVSGTNFISSAGNIGNNAISYSYTNLSGCQSETGFSVLLRDTSVITRNSTDTFICVTEPSFIMNNYTSPAGGNFTGNGVASNSFNAATAGTGTSSITYTYTDLAGCESQYAFNIEVGNETALTKTITDSIFCTTASTVSLVPYFFPTGGIFSGNGIANDNFDPSAAPLGASTIVYQYTNNFGCTSADSFQLTVSVCTGIEADEKNILFNIFPNPGKRNINLSVQVNSVQQIELTVADALGKICFRKKLLLEPNRLVIPLQLPSLATGVYSVQLNGENGKAQKTLVIE